MYRLLFANGDSNMDVLAKKKEKKRKRRKRNKQNPIEKKQVTRGHNIVADGWAGANNPHAYSLPPHAHSYSQTIITAASK